MKTVRSSKKKCIITAVLILVIGIAAILTMHFLRGNGSIFTAGTPEVSMEKGGKISALDREEFSLALTVSSLGDDIYPAASFSIDFDAARLEFLGINEGNVLITDPDKSGGYKLPEWSVDVDRSNSIGQINIMYLDMTGGKYAFKNDALRSEGNVVLRLRFRLRGSAVSGDIYELSFNDAIFAASDENKSLASNKNTLKTSNGRIIVGD